MAQSHSRRKTTSNVKTVETSGQGRLDHDSKSTTQTPAIPSSTETTGTSSLMGNSGTLLDARKEAEEECKEEFIGTVPEPGKTIYVATTDKYGPWKVYKTTKTGAFRLVNELPKDLYNLMRFMVGRKEREFSIMAVEAISFFIRLNEIRDIWATRIKAKGGGGGSVMGAAFTFNTPWGESIRLSPPTLFQGEWSWLESKDDIQRLLEEAGATDIDWDDGRFD